MQGVLNYQSDRKILVFTKGHPFSQDDLKLAFAGLQEQGVEPCFVEQPAAQYLFRADVAAEYDAFVFYDMPGLDFSDEDAPRYVDPPEFFKDSFLKLLEAGKGLSLIHI